MKKGYKLYLIVRGAPRGTQKLASVEGKPITLKGYGSLDGLDLFFHEGIGVRNKEWCISEKKTGQMIGSGATQQAVLDHLKANAEHNPRPYLDRHILRGAREFRRLLRKAHRLGKLKEFKV